MKTTNTRIDGAEFQDINNACYQRRKIEASWLPRLSPKFVLCETK